MDFAKRMEPFGTAIFAALNQERRAMEQTGRRVIDLSVGTPNVPPAPHIIEAMGKATLDAGNYVYAIQDLPELQESVAAWYSRRYGVALDPRTEVSSLLGSQDGLAHISLTLVNPGDTVLVPNPGYPIFSAGPSLAGAKLVTMPQTKENGYIIDLDAIDPVDARAAKLMIVSYPNNPVTSVAGPEFYEKLVDFAHRYDIAVLHDNAYSELAFDGLRCGSFLAYPGAMEIGVEFNSLSKSYGMAGARAGFALGNAEIIGKLKLLKSNIDYGIFIPIQRGAMAALDGPQECVKATAAVYQRRRDLLVDGLNAAGWKIEKPKATMFVWAQIPQGWESSMAFCMELMRRTGVIMVPGSSFGSLGEGFVRIALVQEDQAIAEAVQNIQASGMAHSRA